MDGGEGARAAEGLADLAHLAVRGSCGGDFSSNLRRKGKRVKSKSSPLDSGLNQPESAPRSSDLALVCFLYLPFT